MPAKAGMIPTTVCAWQEHPEKEPLVSELQIPEHTYSQGVSDRLLVSTRRGIVAIRFFPAQYIVHMHQSACEMVGVPIISRQHLSARIIPQIQIGRDSDLPPRIFRILSIYDTTFASQQIVSTGLLATTGIHCRPGSAILKRAGAYHHPELSHTSR
jgi:hypothetical protein